MEPKINLALQILPFSRNVDTYALVDKAIEAIHQSGVTYRVCPFETVMEGDYEQLMQVVRQAQEACFQHGAEDMLVFIKIQRRKSQDVSIADKMEKYGG